MDSALRLQNGAAADEADSGHHALDDAGLGVDAKTIATRLHAVEEELRETVREESRRSGQDQRIAELRERVESQDRNLLSLVMALGHSCLEAAGRISPAANPELPAFARTRPRQPLWRIPIVSSFLAAQGGPAPAALPVRLHAIPIRRPVEIAGAASPPHGQ